MIITKQETQTVDVVTDVICNKCGNTCLKGDGLVSQAEGLVEASVVGGYFSTAIGDMNKVTFSVCEDCLVEFIKGFKIPAQKEDLDR